MRRFWGRVGHAISVEHEDYYRTNRTTKLSERIMNCGRRDG
jgi:hypothetical protein